ncbi:MAG: electron transfer flavoprotein subunit beta/FixA family protein [Flavobacteriales bacterium]|nr:electron transfer flavoprotein subunit beta/FixA family protein [Flavobacteriales bacterium]
MKVYVCIKHVPNTAAKITLEGSTAYDESVKFVVNPYDEWYALVRGLELKEANGGTVTVLNVGGADSDPIIRKALAIGADDAVRIDAETTDALYVAKQIANYAKENGFDMVLSGKETIDYNGSQIGGMVAELMDVPYVSLASKLEMNGNTAIIEREIEGGVEVIEVNGPFVLSAAKGMAEARIPNMRGIMAARSKPLTVVAASDESSATVIKGFTLPPEKSGCKYVDTAEELVALLHNEAKAI